MIVDSSALVAVVKGELGFEALASTIEEAETAKVSAASALETWIVLGAERQALADLTLSVVDIVPFDAEQARIAREAYLRFGKGSRSKAQLNFGDCMTYALVKVTGEPLLFKGDDFTHTDLVSAR